MNIDDGYAQAMADSEATARELLAQFQVQSNEPRKKAVPPPVETSPPVEVRPCLELAAVEVPTIANSEEFEFLPGHFDVHCVISEVLNNAEATSYQIKMRSGELQTVSPRFLSLTYLTYYSEAHRLVVSFRFHFRIFNPSATVKWLWTSFIQNKTTSQNLKTREAAGYAGDLFRIITSHPAPHPHFQARRNPAYRTHFLAI